MEVVVMESEAFFKLIEEVLKRLTQKQTDKDDKWISAEEAMRKLRISSRTTLQKLRDEGKIRFSAPEKKLILYDVDSIHEYLEKNVREPF